MTTGMISNIQRFCLHDGPGIRTTVFFKGCPLSCKWCHNPEMISSKPELHIMETRCIDCGTCLEVCPEKNTGTCRLCGTCVANCPTGARQLIGERLSVDELMKKLYREVLIYDQSEGGITFSGGEPLQQSKFLFEILQACGRCGLHTAVDTCGYSSFDTLKEIASYTNLFLYDVKLMNPIKHKQWTGVSNELILENLEKLTRIHNRIWIRIPVIPGINDNPDEMNVMARFLAPLANVEQIHLLPFHRMGTHKQQQLQRFEPFPAQESIMYHDITSLCEPFLVQNLTVIIGG
jgi:pyruvate formate lyase activating enzyme